MSTSAYRVPKELQNANAPVLFDPPGDVTTTHRLEAIMNDNGPMLNNYIRRVKVGGGQHGDVYLCYRIDPRKASNDPARRIPVAMKSVKRNNPRAEQMKNLRKQRIPASSHVPLSDNLNTTEAKIRKEIAIMKKLRHPHIVRLYEVIDDRMKEKIYMVMEYLGGGEVKWKAQDDRPVLTVAQTRRILRDAVLGLEYLHYQGIIHRDIKPANLLWTEDRRQVKIGDFGVSHFSYAQRLAAAGASDDPADPHDPILLDDSSLTRRAGTPSFLAPEIIYEHTNDAPQQFSPDSSTAATLPAQFLDRPKITKSIDIWALGVTLYCLLFGKIPFCPDEGVTGTAGEYSLYNSICNKDWPVPPTLGFDELPTSSREGANIIHLLEHFLHKDYTVRITLDEVKQHAWILEDLPDPRRWLEVTSPVSRIRVSQGETSDAMSAVHFRWRWGGKFVKQMSSLLRTVRSPPRHQATMPDPTFTTNMSRPVMSDPSIKVRRNRSDFGGVSIPASPISTDSMMTSTITDNNKGKSKQMFYDAREYGAYPIVPPKPIKVKSTKSLRAKSSERHHTLSRGSHSASSSALQNSFMTSSVATTTRSRRRRGSDVAHMENYPKLGTSSPPQTHSRTTTGEKRTRFTDFLHNISNWRPNKYPPIISKPPNYPEAYAKKALASMPATTPGSRRSEEALKYHRRQAMSVHGGDEDMLGGTTSLGDVRDGTSLLTAARRASSWGQGDKELTEVMSMTSLEHELNDHEMNVGAGGVTQDPVVLPVASHALPSPPSSSPSPPPLMMTRKAVESCAAAGPSTQYAVANGSGVGQRSPISPFDDDEFDDCGHVMYDEDASTIASASADSGSGWHRGSELDHDDDEEEEEDDDDDESDGGAVTFSPRRRPQHLQDS